MRVILLATAVLFGVAGCKNKTTDADKKAAPPDTVLVKSDTSSMESNESIVGVWGPVEINMDEGVTPEEKQKILDRATIEFTAGGNYISQFDGDRETGTYSYDEKAKTLVTKKDSGKEDRFTVNWSQGMLNLKMEGGTMVLKRK